jgi:hypothetical protein
MNPPAPRSPAESTCDIASETPSARCSRRSAWKPVNDASDRTDHRPASGKPLGAHVIRHATEERAECYLGLIPTASARRGIAQRTPSHVAGGVSAPNGYRARRLARPGASASRSSRQGCGLSRSADAWAGCPGQRRPITASWPPGRRAPAARRRPPARRGRTALDHPRPTPRRHLCGGGVRSRRSGRETEPSTT